MTMECGQGPKWYETSQLALITQNVSHVSQNTGHSNDIKQSVDRGQAALKD